MVLLCLLIERELRICTENERQLQHGKQPNGECEPLQASFPWLKDRFLYDERGEWRIALKMIVLLYIMWARMVGIDQIQNTFMPYLDHNANKDVWV